MGKIPTDIKEFYNRFNTAPPKKDGEEEEEEDKKDKKKGKKEKGKKKKGKKGKDDGDEKVEVIKIGPTELITKFEEQQENYINNWQDRDETENYKQEYDKKMA